MYLIFLNNISYYVFTSFVNLNNKTIISLSTCLTSFNAYLSTYWCNFVTCSFQKLLESDYQRQKLLVL